MSLKSLYSKNRGTFAPSPTFSQDTYTKYVAQMNSKGTYGNDLVQRNTIDPTFRPPLATSTYLETIFQQGLNKNL